MKYILITRTFRKVLKKYKRYLQEKDVVFDVKSFINSGLRKGDTHLKAQTLFEIKVKTVKIRLCVNQVDFRYLLAIVDNCEFLPILIDLKKGKYGKNLSLKSNKETIDMIKKSLENVVDDYLQYSEDNRTMTIYELT